MTLVIEDGTGKADADSYATIDEFVARAAAYGWTIPQDDEAQEVLLRRAAEQMNARPWKGVATNDGQALAWPRAEVYVGCTLLDDDAIPVAIKNGQMALAAEIHADDLDPPETRTGAVLREKVDVLEVQYAAAKSQRRAAPARPSEVYFANFLARRGLFIPVERV